LARPRLTPKINGTQLALQGRIFIRANKASPKGLTSTVITLQEEAVIHKIFRDLEAIQEASFPLQAKKLSITKD